MHPPRHHSAISLLVLALTFTLMLHATVPANAQTVPLAQHVILVIDENHSYKDVLGGMPWLVGEGNTYGYATNYYSDIGGSLLDYLYLASGSCESSYACSGAPPCNLPPGGHNFYCTGNDCFTVNLSTCQKQSGIKDNITDENIFHLMDSQPISWKVYTENYLNAGGTVNAPDKARTTLYYARHNGAVWYDEVLRNVLGSQGNVVDFEQFGIDVADGTLPRFAIIVPDGYNDAHDGTVGTADTFLKNNLPAMLSQYDFQAGGSGLLIVTFDECGGGTNSNCNGPNGQVYTALIGPNIKTGYISNVSYKHENALKTMLDSLGIRTYPGWSNGAADMTDFFTSTSGGVAIDSPPNGSTQGTSVLVKAAASENGRTIDHLEVWDNTTGLKLGNVPGTTVDQNFTLATGQHQLVVEDVSSVGVTYHKEYTTITVSSSNGVFITTPANNSTQAANVTPGTAGFPVSAYAVESGTPIDHLEVWDNVIGKLGDSPKGSTVNQWYGLAAGAHALTIQDMTSNGTLIHKSTVNITVNATDGVYVNAPVNNSTQTGTTVHVNAYSSEYHSSTLIDHMEVWDNTHNIKLGNSPSGNGITSLYVNQDFTLTHGAGTYQLAISDINTGFVKVHTTFVTVTVQ
jgi:phosphatidylinositol-3-phosphatase